MEIQVWSDVVCPWCYIGKRRLERALTADPPTAEIELRFRSYELDPKAPRNTSERLTDRLSRKYGWSPSQAAQANARVTEVAASEGLTYRLDLAVPSNTFDAHRLLQLAGRLGHRPAVEERLFRAYFTEGAHIGDATVLRRLADEAGLPSSDVARVLDGDEFAAEVRADEEEARTIGARGVPFFVFDRRLAIAGAQSIEVFQDALRRCRTPDPASGPEVEAPGGGPG